MNTESKIPPSIESKLKESIEAGDRRGRLQLATDELVAAVHKYVDPFRVPPASVDFLRICARFSEIVNEAALATFKQGIVEIREHYRKMLNVMHLLGIVQGIGLTIMAYGIGGILSKVLF